MECKIVSIITELTEEQKNKMSEYVDKWKKIGLSCEPVDKQLAEKAINLCYEKANLPIPKKIIWFGSPYSMLIKVGILKNIKNLGLNSNSFDELIDSLNKSIESIIADKSMIKLISDSVRSSLSGCVFGSHFSHVSAFYDFFRNELNLKEQTEKILGIIELTKSCGWIYPTKNICFASERHNILNLNDSGMIHSSTGPAIQYPDGWKIYAINGVRLKEYIVERPHEITVKKIDEESNLEIKRIMIEKYGTSKYLLDSGAELINSDEYGRLYRKEIDGDEPILMVRVINSTAEADGTFKEYFLRVPPEMKTAHDAVAWTFGKTKETYNPTIET